MAPVIFHPHSCEHCQKIVLGRGSLLPTQRPSKDWSSSKSNDRIESRALLDFSFSDLKNGSDNGCQLCAWILDDECISLQDSEKYGIGNSSIAHEELKKALIQAAMWVPSFFPPSAGQTLRKISEERPEDFEDKCLFLGTQENSVDLLVIEFFGLWDQTRKQIAYRTRSGFSIEASDGDPAAAYVTTRPIENDPGSPDTIEKMSSWLQLCLNDHKDSCPVPNSAFMPKRLIEIQNSTGSYCLRLRNTKSVDQSPYIPLSYCWGKDQVIKSTQENISRWMDSIPYDQLPKTLQDAVTTCHHLQVRFLWVDALCIIQDDDTDRAQQISLMPQIYRNAYLTIAAASASDATKGFLHPCSAVDSETMAYKLPYACPNSQSGSVTIYALNPGTNPLDTRAWALQERLLSPRTLEFSEFQVRWLCRGSADKPGWANGWLMRPNYDSNNKNILPKEVFNRAFETTRVVSRVDDGADRRGIMSDWYSLVKVYTNRQLTRPTDRILALAGLAKEYSAVLDDEYLAGLWRKSLLTELMWSIEETKYPAPTTFQGPSWSWTSVDGVVEFKGQYEMDNSSDERYRAKILECKPMLVEESAPFGAVEEYASSLTLEARLLPGLLSAPQPSQRMNAAEEHHVIAMKMNDDGKSHQLKVSIDTSDFVTREPQFAGAFTEVMLLELESKFMRAQWRIMGLVLRSGTISKAQKEEIERRLAAKLQKDEDEASNDGAESVHASRMESSKGSHSVGQIAILRYQFRRYLGDEVNDWSEDQVLEFARENSGQLLGMQPKYKKASEHRGGGKAEAVEPDEQIFYRVGMFEYTSNYWDMTEYANRAHRECDWFKYCVPRVVKIL